MIILKIIYTKITLHQHNLKSDFLKFNQASIANFFIYRNKKQNPYKQWNFQM